jgi:hypothetical protein
VPKLHNIIVYNSAINNIITLKLIKFQVTSVLSVSSVSSVRFWYLLRYFGSCKLGTECFDSVNFGSVLGKFDSVLGSRYFVPTPIDLYTRAQRRIQVQHGAVHAMAGLARRGLIWCWRSLCCTGGGRRQSWFHLGSCESTLAKGGTPQETFWG